MKKIVLIVIAIIFVSININAQNLFLEVGVGIGKIVGVKSPNNKAEVHLNIFKSFKFGQLGLDFSEGGNFIPVNRNIVDENIETLSPYDSKFTYINIFYRLTIKKHFFIEPRFGYSTLFSFVHSDDKTKITRPNFTLGIGIGGNINNLTLSLRYQYLGITPYYKGVRNSTMIQSNPKSLAIMFFRVSYRLRLDNLFSKNHK